MKRVMSENHWSQAELARQAGTSRATVTDWMNGTTQVLTASVSQKLAESTGFNSSWLATGHGDALLPASSASAQSHWPFRVSYEEYQQLPTEKKAALDDVVHAFILGAAPVKSSIREKAA